jgi:outer membrane protein assembly factor BamB
MSQDFVTTLGRQLREAAEREARRGPLRRALPEVRWRPLAVAVAVAAAVAAIVLASLHTGARRAVPTTEHAPQVVARLALADQGGPVFPGFGSLWVADPGTPCRVLRVGSDGATEATIPIAGDLFDVSTGAGAVWALTDSRVYRIDPQTNRVTAAIVLPPPTRDHGGVFTAGGYVWVSDFSELLRIDPRTNRIDKRVRLDQEGQPAYGGAVDARGIYDLRRDGKLVTLDPRTGARVRVVTAELPDPPLLASDGAILVQNGSGVAALNSSTGRIAWRTNLGVSRVNGAAYRGGSLWVQGTPTSGDRDQLWRLDPRTGRVTGQLALPDFGVKGMDLFGGKLWIDSAAGTFIVIR